MMESNRGKNEFGRSVPVPSYVDLNIVNTSLPQSEITAPGGEALPSVDESAALAAELPPPQTMREAEERYFSDLRDLRDRPDIDWTALVNDYLDQLHGSPVAEGRQPVDVACLLAQFNTTPDDVFTDVTEVQGRHEELVALLQDLEAGDYSQPDIPEWQPPTDWRPRKPRDKDTWADTMAALGKFVGPARQKFLEKNTNITRVREITALEQLAWRQDEDDATPQLFAPMQLVHALQKRKDVAFRGFYAADIENLAAVAETLPEAVAIEDPGNVAAMIGIEDPLAWVSEKLEDIPDHIKQGLGIVHLTTYPDSADGIATDMWQPRVIYDAETHAVTIHIHANRLRANMVEDPSDSDGAQQAYDNDLRTGLIAAALQHDRTTHLSMHALTEWMKAWVQDVQMGGPTAGHAAKLTDNGVETIDPDVRDYALAGTRFFLDPDATILAPGYSYRSGFMVYRAKGWGGQFPYTEE